MIDSSTKVSPEQSDGVTELQSNGATECRSYRDSDATDETHDAASFSVRIQTLQEAARIALQKGPGDPSFRFARAVKAFEKTTGVNLPKCEIESAFNVWWPIAKPTLPADADRDEFLFLFRDAYERAKVPLGSNVLQEVIKRMDSMTPPAEAGQYASPKIKRLVHLCYALQTVTGNSPFFLSVRDASRIINCPRLETVSAFLRGLVTDGVLEMTEPGTAGGRRAARFRYCALNKPKPKKKERCVPNI